MTRTEAIEIITATLPSLDEQQAAALAQVAQAMAKPVAVPLSLSLTDEERAGIERAREDFKAGRTHSSSEARAMTAAFLTKRRGASSGG